MNGERVIEVPTIWEGSEKDREFRNQVAAGLRHGGRIVLDTRSQPAVSTTILAYVMFHLGERRCQIVLINVSNYLLQTLRTIMGPAAYEVVRGPILNLDAEIEMPGT